MLSQVATPGLFFNLVPWVVLFPLIGLLINLFFGRRMSQRLVGIIASLAAGATFVISVLLALSLGGQPNGVTVPFMNWITIGTLNVAWAFRVDTLSVTMMLVVSGVGTLIHVYSTGYMSRDVRYNSDPSRYSRFFVDLNLFILAMMLLVSADNFLMTFVGWEGVGLCSYLLISFWFEKGAEGLGNARAGMKAFVVNRIGDLGFLIAMFLIFWGFGSLRFEEVFPMAAQIAGSNPGLILAITLFFLLAVTGKSAQLPLYVWLPDAMAGPTPVSALIHAATMVTAGVYLVARSAPFYVQVPLAQDIVAWVGAATAIFASTIAIGQFDIKKVLAYSTISQLGYMVAAVGMGAFVAGMFHLVTHAFFKALLFLAAGSVIQGIEQGEHHAPARAAPKKGREAPVRQNLSASETAHLSEGHEHFDAQDMRNMGGLRARMPLTFRVYVIGALALSGIFPLSGFFSKDEILASASQLGQTGILVVLVVAAFLTAFYMGRQVFLVFFGQPRSDEAGRARENPPVMTTPLLILAGLSVLGGVINLPGVNSLEKWLEHSITGIRPISFLLPLALTALAVAVLGILIAWLVYGGNPLAKGAAEPLRSRLGPLFVAFERKWYIDDIYNTVFVGGYKALARFTANPIDLGIIDGFGNRLVDGARAASGALRRFQNGLVRSYALLVLAGVVVILAYLIFR